MIFRQVLHGDLGCASYFVADDGAAVVVDPRWEVDEYLALAVEHGVEIRHILETHTHADHLSGTGLLVAETGATIHVSAHADVAFPHRPLVDGDTIGVGRVRLTALSAPGHRPEHLAFAVADLTRSPDPWALLSGDSLLVGDVARPDLAVDRREGAAALYQTLSRIRTFDDGVEVWPGHVGGSLCGGAGMNRKPSSTAGCERRWNALFAVGDERELIDALLAKLPPKPSNFERIVELNRGSLISSRWPVTRLSPQHVQRLLEAVGFRNVHGLLAGGLDAWVKLRLPVTSARTIDLLELARELRRGGLQLLDVHEDDEREAAHVPGSLHVPCRDLRARLAEGLPNGTPLAVACATGSRSALAASVLGRAGRKDVVRLARNGVHELADFGFELEAA